MSTSPHIHQTLFGEWSSPVVWSQTGLTALVWSLVFLLWVGRNLLALYQLVWSSLLQDQVGQLHQQLDQVKQTTSQPVTHPPPVVTNCRQGREEEVVTERKPQLTGDDDDYRSLSLAARSQSCLPISCTNDLDSGHSINSNATLHKTADDPDDSASIANQALNLSQTLRDHCVALTTAVGHSGDSSSCSDVDLKVGQGHSTLQKAVKLQKKVSPTHGKYRGSLTLVERPVNPRGRAGGGGSHGVPQRVRRTAPHERAYNETQRLRIFRELVSTERTYCSGLWTLIDVIAETFKQASFLPMKDLCVIFPPSLPRLYSLHATLLNDLEQLEIPCLHYISLHHTPSPSTERQILEPSAPLLEAFCRHEREFFALYRSYLFQFTRAVSRISKYMKHSAKFRRLIKKLRNHPSCASLDLPAFLVTPVQRLPRYLLLVKQLSNYTPEHHRDRRSLTTVQMELETFLKEINSDIAQALDSSAEVGREQTGSSSGSCDSLCQSDTEISRTHQHSVTSSPTGEDPVGGKFALLSRLLSRHQRTTKIDEIDSSEHFLRNRDSPTNASSSATYDIDVDSNPRGSRVLLRQGTVVMATTAMNGRSNTPVAHETSGRELLRQQELRPQSVPPGLPLTPLNGWQSMHHGTCTLVDSRSSRGGATSILSRPTSVEPGATKKVINQSGPSIDYSNRNSLPIRQPNNQYQSIGVVPSHPFSIKESFKKMFNKKRHTLGDSLPPLPNDDNDILEARSSSLNSLDESLQSSKDENGNSCV